MTFCAAITGALAAYAGAEFAGRRWALVVFYGLVAIAFWTKGPAGLLPLAVVAVYLGLTYGWSGLRRLVSAPGMVLLLLLMGAWVVPIVLASRTEQFLHDVVVTDLLLWYVSTTGQGWRHLLQPPLQALTILLPWSVLLLGALWTTAHSADSESGRRARLMLVWLGVIFLLVAVTREQRMRYYLPLCPPAALLIARWYATLRSRSRAVGFACVWLLIVAGGLTIDAYAQARHNARTDLVAASRAFSRTTRLYAVEAPELVFAFYLERPVTVLPTYRDFEARTQAGHDDGLIIAEHAIPTSLGEHVHRGATAVVDRRRVAILASGRL